MTRFYFVMNESGGAWPDYAIGPFASKDDGVRFRNAVPSLLARFGRLDSDIRDLTVESPEDLISLEMVETAEGWTVAPFETAPPGPGIKEQVDAVFSGIMEKVFSDDPDPKARASRFRSDLDSLVDRYLPSKKAKPDGD